MSTPRPFFAPSTRASAELKRKIDQTGNDLGTLPPKQARVVDESHLAVQQLANHFLARIQMHVAQNAQSPSLPTQQEKSASQKPPEVPVTPSSRDPKYAPSHLLFLPNPPQEIVSPQHAWPTLANSQKQE